MFGRILLVVLAIAVIGGAYQKSESKLSGQHFSITWELLENNVRDTGNFSSELIITNHGKVPLGAEGWSLYFNFARTIDSKGVTGGVAIQHINGDFYRLVPTSEFKELHRGDTLRVGFKGGAWVVKECEAPAGLYWVFKGMDPEPVADYRIVPFTRKEQQTRNPSDLVPGPDARLRYQKNRSLEDVPNSDIPPLIPRPVRLEKAEGIFRITAQTSILRPEELREEAEFLAERLEEVAGFQLDQRTGPGTPGSISLELGPISATRRLESGDQGYSLKVSPDTGVSIVGTDPAGVFYGIQTLRALLPLQVFKEKRDFLELASVSITDYPRFRYRGMHLDVGRNFHSKESVKRLLELMAFYKLNKFHFHLTDDEGWRLEIKGLPELTLLGSRRGHTLDEEEYLVPSFGSGPDPSPAATVGSGYYSRADFIEILRLARRLHIEIIPEIDTPGHARAAIKSMEARARRLRSEGKAEEAERFLLHDPKDQSKYQSVQGWTDNVVNPCQESTYRFLEHVVDDVIAMYSEAGAELTIVHTGGDEVPHGVWTASPICQTRLEKGELEGVADVSQLSSYFIRRFNQILTQRGLVTAGWEEIGLTGSTHDTDKAPNPEFTGSKFLLYVWNSVWGWGGEENAYKLANAGYPVILCNVSNLYFDLAYNKDSKEPGYYWGGFVDTRQPFEFIPFDLYKGAIETLMGQPISPEVVRDFEPLSETGRANIKGIQAQLWSENAKGRELMEYALLPKLIAFSERAWAQERDWMSIENREKRLAELERDWAAFSHRIGRVELPRLDYLMGGWNYRIPLPGAVVEEGVLKANVEFPGLAIRYTTDGSEPDPTSALCEGPLPVKLPVKLRAFDTRGRGGRVVTIE